MNEDAFFRIRIYITAIVFLAIWSLLTWNYFHGGVPSHSILAREDMPSISNWWCAVLLPSLTWSLLYRIQKRITDHPTEKQTALKPPIGIVYRFVGALLFGIVLSIFFTLRMEEIPGYMVMSLFGLALFIPIYRAECLLGFVMGMTFTFGAVLPTGIGSIFVLIGAVLYWLVRKALKLVGYKSN